MFGHLVDIVKRGRRRGRYLTEFKVCSFVNALIASRSFIASRTQSLNECVLDPAATAATVTYLVVICHLN